MLAPPISDCMFVETLRRNVFTGVGAASGAPTGNYCASKLPLRARQSALEDKLKERKRTRLIAELSKLDPKEERHLAEEFLQLDAEQWDEQ